MKAVVPAAGEGTRLRPLTEDTPKGLVQIRGRPLLAYCFDRLVELGVTEIVVVIGYRGQRIREHFGDVYRDVPLTYVTQERRLGLAHALLQAREHVGEAFVLLNGDNVFATSLADVLDSQSLERSDATLLVERTTPEVARTTGVVVTDDDGSVTDLVEKPSDPPSTLVTTGCYVLPPAVFEACDRIEPSDRGEYELPDAIEWLRTRGRTVRAVRFDGERVNVNTPADLDRAESLLGD